MGYSTKFDGKITLTPPLTPDQTLLLRNFSQERHGGDADYTSGMPGFWCDIEPTSDGSALRWNGSEKTYDFAAWMRYLIENHLRKMGVSASGEILAQGEEIRDRWILTVTDNVVTTRTLP